MTHSEQLRQKIETRKARTGVVGLGYVGLPLAVELAHAGFSVTGIDIDQAKVDSLNRGESYIQDIPTSVLKPLVEKGLIKRMEVRGGYLDVMLIATARPL